MDAGRTRGDFNRSRNCDPCGGAGTEVGNWIGRSGILERVLDTDDYDLYRVNRADSPTAD